MVVHDNDRVGRGHDRRPKYVAGMRDAFVHTPARDFLDSDQMITRIEQNHAQRFLVPRAHFRSHQFVNELRRIELLPGEAFIRQPLAKSECRHQLDRLRLANAGNLFDLLHRASAQA